MTNGVQFEDTVWEKIYKEYQDTGKEWGTLRDDLHPSFIALVSNSSFQLKRALDIGCGNGKYLRHLEDEGFRVTGVDSSNTAIAMARKLLSEAAVLCVKDMYNYSPGNELYDLVVSHAALHHGKNPMSWLY